MPKQCLQEQWIARVDVSLAKGLRNSPLPPSCPEGIHISSNESAYLFWFLGQIQSCSYSLSLLTL